MMNTTQTLIGARILRLKQADVIDRMLQLPRNGRET